MELVLAGEGLAPLLDQCVPRKTTGWINPEN
jgi:hypothetical protein